MSIPASFDAAMQAVTDGYGTRRSGTIPYNRAVRRRAARPDPRSAALAQARPGALEGVGSSAAARVRSPAL